MADTRPNAYGCICAAVGAGRAVMDRGAGEKVTSKCIKIRVGESGLDSPGSRYVQVTALCKHRNKPSVNVVSLRLYTEWNLLFNHLCRQ